MRTFLGVDKKRNPGFSLLCQTPDCVMTQKLSGILLNYYYYYFLNWTFFGLRSGPLAFFGPGFSLKDFFWV